MPAKDRPTQATVAVVGRNQQRVNVLLEALKSDGLPAIGTTSMSGLRTALVEFPSVKTVVFLYSEDTMAPFECVVLRVDSASIRNYYTLASTIGWLSTCNHGSKDGNIEHVATLLEAA